MLRSLFSGVSGLRNHQLKMDVIGNNIANVNTAGYKTSRVVFQEMYSQTLRGASGPTTVTGGTNPQQVGLGVSTAAIDVVHDAGNVQTTDQPLDFAIEGDGFFIIKKGDSSYYTRAGNFYLDTNFSMVNANGLLLMGLGKQEVDDNPSSVTYGQVTYTPPDSSLVNADGSYKEGALNSIRIPDTGFYSTFSVDRNGTITAVEAASSQMVVIGQLAVSTFINPGGLKRVGNSLYELTNNSGNPRYSKPLEGGAGELKPGALEMSNVDLSREFTEMIITQRGFQANSRVITVSDTLLEELINLKR